MVVAMRMGVGWCRRAIKVLDEGVVRLADSLKLGGGVLIPWILVWVGFEGKLGRRQDAVGRRQYMRSNTRLTCLYADLTASSDASCSEIPGVPFNQRRGSLPKTRTCSRPSTAYASTTLGCLWAMVSKREWRGS